MKIKTFTIITAVFILLYLLLFKSSFLNAAIRTNLEKNGFGKFISSSATTEVGKTKQMVNGTALGTQVAGSSGNRPKILIWAKQYGPIKHTHPDLPNGDGGCDITFERSEYSSSDAIIFFMKSCSARDLPDPKIRRSNQAFVWWSHESPWTVLHFYHHDLKFFKNYFNWTMTFRADSDVLASLAPVPALDYLLLALGRTDEVIDKEISKRQPMPANEYERQIAKLMSRKAKLAAWVASDCDVTAGAAKRMKIIKDFSRVVKFDTFGKCGSQPLSKSYYALMKTLSAYKFYLAFENSFRCRDYVTEKFFYNGLTAGTVPVVLGPTRRDVEKFAPAGAFIHVDDFDNLTSLAKYLEYLDNNDTAYIAYFTWWKSPEALTWPRHGFNYGSGDTPERTGPGAGWTWDLVMQEYLTEQQRFGIYHLCRKLKNGDHEKTSKVIVDLAQFWYNSEPSECIGTDKG